VKVSFFLGHFLSLDLGMALRLFIAFLFGSAQIIMIIKILCNISSVFKSEEHHSGYNPL